MPDEYCRPSDRWVSLCKFSRLSWVVVSTNQSLETLFDDFSQRRRLEFVWINWDSGVLQVKANKSKEIQVDLRSSDSKVEIEAKDKAFRKSLQACSNNPQRLSCVLEYFDIPSKIPGVIARNGKFEVIGKSGKRVKSGVKEFTIFNAYGSEEGASDASKLLDDALDICDLSKIKKAIELGASLDRLPETTLTPLTKALFKIDRYQNWEQCAQALVDAGADVNGAGEREPPIIAVCSHLLEADQTVELLRFLIKNGASIEPAAPNQRSALGVSVLQRKTEAVKLLVKAGANVEARCLQFSQESILDFAKRTVKEGFEERGVSEFVEILESLTGEKVTIPTVNVDDDLMAEANRMRQACETNHQIALLKDLLPPEPEASLKIASLPEIKQATAGFAALGFSQSACFKMMADDIALGITSELGYDYSATTASKMVSIVEVVVMTNPKLRMDVLISTNRHEDVPLRIEVFARTDNEIWVVCDQKFFEIEGTCVRRSILNKAAPEKMVQKLVSLTKKLNLSDTTIKSSVVRTQDLVRKMRDSTIQTLRSANDLSDSDSPRYERLHQFVELWDVDKYPHQTVRDFALQKLEDLQRDIDVENGWKLSGTLEATAQLLAMEHLQYQGGLPRANYFGNSLEHALAWLEYLESNPKEPLDEDWGIGYTIFAWMIFLLDEADKNNENWLRYCAVMKANLTKCRSSAFTSREPDIAKVLLLVASKHIETPVRGSKSFAKQIAVGKSTQAKRLLELWQAIESGDQSEFELALPKSLTQTAKFLAKHRSKHHAFFKFAWFESTFVLLAKRGGLSIPELAREHSDLLFQS